MTGTISSSDKNSMMISVWGYQVALHFAQEPDVQVARIIFEMDSWYTCKRLWDKVFEKEITLIGAMKTNRIL